jgi:NAD(P)-dependent dehydrogenase (short-subunit alcohol dehydrogenase family)/pimeloyl-ACP methyl ester carboxylesterase
MPSSDGSFTRMSSTENRAFSDDGRAFTLPSTAVFERRVRGDGVDLAVTERGIPGAPTLVLVHGYPDSQLVWTDVAVALAKRFHVVTYDVRGAGRSSVPGKQSDYSLGHLSRDLLAVLDAVAPGKAVHLVGHDWGSIASWESVTDPDFFPRLASFTSISGPCLDHVGHWLRDYAGPDPEKAAKLVKQVAKSWYVAAFHLPWLAPFAWSSGLAKAIPALMERGEGVPRDEGRERTRASDGLHGIALYRENMLPRFFSPRERTTRVPVQVVCPKGDAYVSPWLSEGLDRFVPTLFRREVEGSHWMPLAHPNRVVRWIEEMVDHVEGSRKSPSLERLRGAKPRKKLALVTGGGSGIGRETALALAREGHALVVADIDHESARETAERCRALGVDAVARVVDVANADAMTTFAETTLREDGVPDVLVLNAGIGLAGSFFDTTVAEWERVLGVNVWGVIHGARLLGRAMRDRGEGGHVVITASAAAFAPSKALPAYATTKAAVLMLAECLRTELAREGIGVSAICPGLIDTPITRRTRFAGSDETSQEAQREAAEKLYRMRGVGPEVVARAIVEAIEDDTAVVPVAAEAHVLRFLSRAAPSLVRRIGALDLAPKSTKSREKRA